MDPAMSNGVALFTGMEQCISCLSAKEGCTRLFLADISEGSLAQTRGMIEKQNPDAKVVTHVVKIAKEPTVIDMVAACVKAFGRLDCAVNCAGIARGSTKTTDLSLETFDVLCSVNEKGIWLCQGHELRQMSTQDIIPLPGADPNRGSRGSIVHMASMSATTALGELGAYTSSKHGVLGFARVDAREYAGRGIRINCVSPGFVNTSMMQGARLSEEFLAMTKAQSPMERMTHAEEVAEAAVFLSSGWVSGITGSDLLVDAGAKLFHSF